MGEVFGFIALSLFNIGCAWYCMTTRKETIKRQATFIIDVMNENTNLKEETNNLRKIMDHKRDCIRCTRDGDDCTCEPLDYALEQAAVRAFDEAQERCDHSVSIIACPIVKMREDTK